jgi:cobalt-zinc-cadmium efflux system membrane fusion protein
MKTFLSLAIIISSLLLGSCKSTPSQDEIINELVEITKEQFISEKMELGEPTLKTFSETLMITGNIVPKVNGKAQVGLPLMGIVDKIYCTEGQKVTKGQLLFDISGLALIDLQKEFAESSAILIRLKSEYERVNELYNENVGTQKDLMLAESSFKVEKARHMALLLKLDRIGLDIKRIEEGSFYNSFQVKSPMNGYVINLNATIGQYIEQQVILAEVIDTDQFQFKFNVFEKDVNRLKAGQLISFNILADRSIEYNARIKTIGRAINNETKSIDCFAEIESKLLQNNIINQFCEGKITVDSFDAISVPAEAVISSEEGAYILNLIEETNESYFFDKVFVTPGSVNKEDIELKDPPSVNKIIVKGTYNIL